MENKLRCLLHNLLLTVLVALAPIGCDIGRQVATGDGPGEGGSDTESDTEPSGPLVDVHGVVMAPSGLFSIAGALVYLTTGDGLEIPNGAYCYECDDMTGKHWTLSNADGSFTLSDVPAGSWNIVTRKGFFQRQRAVEISEASNQTVPTETTTLPQMNEIGGADRIPNFAVLYNTLDRAQDTLSKLGMGELADNGYHQFGSERFVIYSDNDYEPGYPDSSELFADLSTLAQYHMVFFPCICDHLDSADYASMIQQYVEDGGRIYSSCWASQWIERPFPDVIAFGGDEAVIHPGDVGEYDTYAKIEDPALRDWLSVVTTEDLDHFLVDGAWIMIDVLNQVDNGMGLPDDDGWVVPRNLVTDQGNGFMGYAGHPMTTTFDWGCGRAVYSVYQVVENSPSPSIRPQEYILLYTILEAGVCQGDYVLE